MAKTFFITTAIDYTNAAPHIGHAYEKILADVIARYHRLKGEPVFFLTGVDQHGQKVQQTAQKEGRPPEEFAREVTQKFIALWEKLGIRYDGWAATTDDHHKVIVRKILDRLHAAGAIYKAEHSGFYSVRQEQFLTDKERGPDGEFGPEWGEVTEISEENYYFRLAPYRDWLLQYIASHPGYVFPDFRQVELRNAVERLGGDLCISRPKSRLSWGIELPFDGDYVTYVWFDALINYISFSGFLSDEAGFRERWPALHVIGKDILVPAHGVYWPIMLHALGFPDEEIPPLLVHGYVNIAGAKMSKSIGNIVDPDLLVDRHGADALRYYLMRESTTGQDMDFSEDRLIQRYNTDLANDLGNLLNRTLNMAHRYREGIVRAPAQATPFMEEILRTIAAWQERFEQHHIHGALEAAWTLVSRCNGMIEEKAPWKLAKDPSPEAAAQLDDVLYHLAAALRALSVLIAPVLPSAAAGMAAQLQTAPEASVNDLYEPLADGHQLGKPTPLFPRIETERA